MTWLEQRLGPDGPWQGVTVDIGYLQRPVTLYLGGSWESIIILPSLCENTTISSVCYADEAGLYNPESSPTWDNTSIALAPDGLWQWGALKKHHCTR